ncbi:hypothetical protein PFISCL1PPCAC_4732, partial [Pristionchus fissidentatus]
SAITASSAAIRDEIEARCESRAPLVNTSAPDRIESREYVDIGRGCGSSMKSSSRGTSSSSILSPSSSSSLI